MAHYLRRHTRSNPDLLGFGLEDIGLEAAGLAATQLISGQFTLPFAKTLYAAPAGIMAGLEDAASAAVTGWVEGQVLRAVDGHETAHRVERGAALLVLAKVVSAFIPSVGLTVNTGGLSLPGMAPVAGQMAPTPVGGQGPALLTSGQQAAGMPMGASGAGGAQTLANPQIPASQQKYPAISGYGATSSQASLGL